MSDRPEPVMVSWWEWLTSWLARLVRWGVREELVERLQSRAEHRERNPPTRTDTVGWAATRRNLQTVRK